MKVGVNMGLFTRRRKKDDIDLEQYNKAFNGYNNLNKSFHNGRSINVSYLGNGGIQTGQPQNRTKDSKSKTVLQDINIRRVLRQKLYLNQMSNNILVQSIIRTRTSQVLKFCKPARLTDDGIGYKIVPRDEKNVKNSTQEKNKINDLEDFIYYTGKKNQYKECRDTFPSFIEKLLNDFFVHDQINIERIYESKASNVLNHFNIADASTIVIKTLPKSIDTPRTFAQYVDNEEKVTFNEHEMTFITYWGKSEIMYNGYGVSPLLVALQHLDYHNDTTQYNGRFFKQGGTTKGLLFIDTDGQQMSAEQLDGIRRAWQPINGLNGAWKIPMVTGIKDAKFVNMQQSSTDYEFAGWLSYLINMVSSVFQIEPSEINFPNKSGGSMSRGGGSTLNEGNTARTKANLSKEKGLKPILDFIERVVNDYILKYVDDDYYFKFTLGSEDELNRANIIEKQLRNGMTISEARQAMGLGKLGGDLEKLTETIPGDAVTLVQYLALQAKLDPEQNKEQQHSQDINRPNREVSSANNNNNEEDNSNVDNQDNNDSVDINNDTKDDNSDETD